MSFWQFLQQNRNEILNAAAVQHLVLVFTATLIAVAIGVADGVLLIAISRCAAPVLGLANVMQTIPSLALFGFLIPLPFIGGIGPTRRNCALVLRVAADYSQHGHGNSRRRSKCARGGK